jgi:hypothetical protein
MTATRHKSHPALFVLLSAVVHFAGVTALAALAWEPLFVPRIQVTWLDLDNKLGAPRPGPKPKSKVPKPSPPKTKKAPPAKRRKPSRKPARKKVAMVKPDAGVPPSDAGVAGTAAPLLSDLAPGDAALILVLRMDRIQGSPYEASVRRLLQVFYDHKTLLWTSSGLDPVKDFETLLIATPNPYRLTRTFLAVRHRLPRHRIRRALERSVRYGRGRMRWSRRGKLERGDIPAPPKLPHDPRVVLLGDGLVMLTDPNHVPLLSTDLSAPAPRPGKSPNASPDAGIRTGQGWLESLRRMNRTGGLGKDVPGMQLMAINLRRLVRLPPDIPVPHSFRVTIRAKAPTVARGEILFDHEAGAKRFLQVIPKRIAKAKRSLLLRLLGVTDLLDGIKLKRDGLQVRARLKLSAKQVRSLLELFRGMIPQVRVPGMPPRNPPDAGPTASPDAGPTRPATPDAKPPR